MSRVTEKTLELRKQVKELRKQGLSYGKISRKLDLSQQYVMVLANPEKYNDEHHKKLISDYGKRNREKITAKHKEWRAKNPDYYKEYYASHKDYASAQAKKRYQERKQQSKVEE